MKNLITSLLVLIVGCFTGLGAISPSSEPNYDFDTNTCLYGALGFGTKDALMRFMTNQITIIEIGVYQQNGTGGFDHGAKYYFDKYVESLEDFTLRISNEEFQRQVQAHGYKLNQKFSLMYYFLNEITGGEFWADKVSFTPKKVGDLYVVPDNIYSLLKIVPTTDAIGDRVSIYWKGIVRASLNIFRKDGSQLFSFSGDANSSYANAIKKDFQIVQDQELLISRRFVTNGYTGTLTVALKNGSSAVYLIENGSLVFYPQTIQPFLKIKRVGSNIVVNVSGGAPGLNVSLLCYGDPNSAPHEEVISLDDLGMSTWTNHSTTSFGIFQTRYPYDESSLLKKK